MLLDNMCSTLPTLFLIFECYYWSKDVFRVHVDQVKEANPETECTVCACVSLSGDSGEALYKRNEKLDKKISLFSGDITKLEIDAVVNAGM